MSSFEWLRCTRSFDAGREASPRPGPPIVRRPDRARREAAAAIRTDVAQLIVDAVGAEGALVGADARLRAVRRKILVAIFAIGSKRECHSAAVINGI